MFRIQFLLTSLILLTASLFSQDLTQAPKKTNLIIVKGATIQEAVPLLLTNGYTMDKIDEVYKFLSTKPKNLKKSTNTVILNIMEKDSSLYISGTFDMNMRLDMGGISSDLAPSPIENKGMKKSALRETFEEMDRVAKSFGKEIEYKIQ